MNISTRYQGKTQVISLDDGATARDLLDAMKINPETVLVGRAGEIILEAALLKDKDEIELIRVISGG